MLGRCFYEERRLGECVLSPDEMVDYGEHPSSWLTFLIMGGPASLDRLSSLFNKGRGIATKVIAEGQGLSARSCCELDGRIARKRHYA